jgi:long-chain acyl-CoA synthetase
MLAAWVAEAASTDLAPSTRLRWVLSAGAPLADEVARRAEAVLGTEVRQGYGMTEATFAAINAPPDARVIGSVGKPVFGVHVRVIDTEGPVGDALGGDAPVGQSGELFIRGHNVMNGYLGKEPVLGFVQSGDIGRFDDEGRLYVVDRLKDLVIRGGHNVYPSEVEDALMTHPAVREVAVVGRPDDYYGEEVVAVIVLRDGMSASTEALHAHALERVSRIKAPREIAFVTSLPLGASGKVNKRWLRAQLVSGTLTVTRLGKPQGA